GLVYCRCDIREPPFPLLLSCLSHSSSASLCPSISVLLYLPPQHPPSQRWRVSRLLRRLGPSALGEDPSSFPLIWSIFPWSLFFLCPPRLLQPSLCLSVLQVPVSPALGVKEINIVFHRGAVNN
ncbi:hypothetical protein XENORESO_010414, partial [Xenotaenia resolanae]